MTSPYNYCSMSKHRDSAHCAGNAQGTRERSVSHGTSVNRRVLLSGASLLLVSGFVSSARAEELVVVVHPDNAENPTRAQLAAMFTTRMQSWNNGGRVVPLNFPPRHELRVNFDRSVLQMSPDEVARYWIDRKIRGGNPPPKSIENPQLICRLVAKLPGSVGYVPRSVAAGVRIVHDV